MGYMGPFGVGRLDTGPGVLRPAKRGRPPRGRTWVYIAAILRFSSLLFLSSSFLVLLLAIADISIIVTIV